MIQNKSFIEKLKRLGELLKLHFKTTLSVICTKALFENFLVRVYKQ